MESLMRFCDNFLLALVNVSVFGLLSMSSSFVLPNQQ